MINEISLAVLWTQLGSLWIMMPLAIADVDLYVYKVIYMWGTFASFMAILAGSMVVVFCKHEIITFYEDPFFICVCMFFCGISMTASGLVGALYHKCRYYKESKHNNDDEYVKYKALVPEEGFEV